MLPLPQGRGGNAMPCLDERFLGKHPLLNAQTYTLDPNDVDHETVVTVFTTVGTSSETEEYCC